MTVRQEHATVDVAVDPEHPWLGLSSYTEETRAYFHGRDEEAAELARRVQRKNLTVLFGQSGLGKTSLLKAGLVPRLRNEGYCPVYVRVDYSPESPPPAEQIKQAIFRATSEAGHWTRPGTAVEGESLWEFLHHRGDLLRDASGATLLPLLIFDQFEEIFTLAQADDAGRLRAKQFVEDLADLVENRPPMSLEARLDQDEAAAEDFDFARADYRILIALREDYLAHLESLKGVMPSITQNRMRLARMTGEEALSAVMQPGGRLVTQEVAESIVRFVAGGAELRNAEVEPSLLSLVCRELNNVRVARGQKEISADLLAGSREEILGEFYERALADQPAGVRRVIEDELLTESGYRESLAEERVKKALDAAGAAPDALAKLVDRRLLRIEERLDVRRVELTHDVLCSVVASSRDLRHEREARDDAERQLAAQREREAATKRALVRARTIAAVCAVLMVVAILSAVFGWVSMQRAKKADLQAQQARGDAEKLVGFLIEDFYEELEPTGRLETLGKLSNQAVKYFDGLPPELVTPQTQVYRGMALIREGRALLAGDKIEEGSRRIREARQLFETMHAGGDKSEPVTIGLALSLVTPYLAWGPLGGPESKSSDLPQAVDLLRPLVSQPEGSRQAKLLYGDILNHLSHAQPKEQGIASCEEGRRVLASLGAKTLEDLTAASIYADTADSQARHALGLGRDADAERLELEVYEIAEGVLARRPGDIRSMKNRALAAGLLGDIAMRRHDDVKAAEFAQRAKAAGEDLVRFNPSDLGSWQHLIRGREQIADIMFQQGEVDASIAQSRETVELAKDERLKSSLDPMLEDAWYALAWTEAELGRREAAESTFASAAKAGAVSASQWAKDNPIRDLSTIRIAMSRARLHFLLGDHQRALDEAMAVGRDLESRSILRDDARAARFYNNLTHASLIVASESALRLGRLEEAEKLARRREGLPPVSFGNAEANAARDRVLLAQVLATQGRGAEAREVLAPALEYYRKEKQAGATGTDFSMDYARAFYVSAISQGSDVSGLAARRSEFADAERQLAALSAEARQLKSAREVAAWISSARGSSAT
jgi:hypothetical protein